MGASAQPDHRKNGLARNKGRDMATAALDDAGHIVAGDVGQVAGMDKAHLAVAPADVGGVEAGGMNLDAQLVCGGHR